MIPQPAITLQFRQSLSPHLHVDNETCKWCGQEIPPEKLQEISGKIAAKEREQVQAITAKLEQQHAIDKAQADAKAKADLELERQHSAAREGAAREEARKAAEAEAAEKLAEVESSRQEMQEQLLALQRTTEAELAKLKEDAAAEMIRVRLEAIATTGASFQEKIAANEQAATEAIAKAQEAENKLATLTEQHESIMNERLHAQREILEKAKNDEINAVKAKAFEENQKQVEKLNEMQRALEKKTNDELGEGAEVDLFESLKTEFPDDRITRIVKGVQGADVLHVVMLNGKACGTIIYDSKNHAQFRNDHVTKLRTDQLAAKAEHAILSTRKFPTKTSQLHIEDGVLLANPARVVALVTIIRQHMMRIHTLRLSGAERENKTATLYDFITSDRCTQFFSRVDANAQELLDLQVKEKKFHDTAWKKEGELIKQIQKTQADLSNEISCIIGTASDDALHLEETEQ